MINPMKQAEGGSSSSYCLRRQLEATDEDQVVEIYSNPGVIRSKMPFLKGIFIHLFFHSSKNYVLSIYYLPLSAINSAGHWGCDSQ